MADVTQAPHPVVLGGVEYTLAPLTDVDIEELNNWLRSDVIRMARDALTEDMTPAERAEILGVAMDKARGLSWLSGEGAAAMASLSGIARVLWQGLRANHPELTWKRVQELIMDKRTLDYALAIWRELNLGPVRTPKGKGGTTRPGSPKARRRRKRRSTGG